MRKLLIAVDAPGPAEFIAPVIPLLRGTRDMGHETRDSKHKTRDIRLITVGKPDTEILKQYQPIQCRTRRDAERVFNSFRPDRVLLGMSSLPKAPVHRALVTLASKETIPLIAFQDYWGNHRNPENKPIVKHAQKILVPDLFAQTLVLEDGYRGEIVITGNPAFEKFSRVNVARERATIRKQFKIPARAFLVLYIGTGTPQSALADEITFTFFANAIRKLISDANRSRIHANDAKSILVTVRSHPRDENSNRYAELAPKLKTIDTSRMRLTDTLLPAADAVVSMYSTSLIHACYLHIPAVSILLPNAGRKRLKQIKLDDFPPNTTGATIKISKNSPTLLAQTLAHIARDKNFRGKLMAKQKQYFGTAYGATRAVRAALG